MSKIKIMQMTIFDVPQNKENNILQVFGQSAKTSSGIDFYTLSYPLQDVSKKTISQTTGLVVQEQCEILTLKYIESWTKTLCRN